MNNSAGTIFTVQNLSDSFLLLCNFTTERVAYHQRVTALLHELARDGMTYLYDITACDNHLNTQCPTNRAHTLSDAN